MLGPRYSGTTNGPRNSRPRDFSLMKPRDLTVLVRVERVEHCYRRTG